MLPSLPEARAWNLQGVLPGSRAQEQAAWAPGPTVSPMGTDQRSALSTTLQIQANASAVFKNMLQITKTKFYSQHLGVKQGDVHTQGSLCVLLPKLSCELHPTGMPPSQAVSLEGDTELHSGYLGHKIFQESYSPLLLEISNRGYTYPWVGAYFIGLCM